MHDFQIVALLLLNLYITILVARIIIEMIQSFSRSFSPPRWFYFVAEPIFVVTDPPVKLFRKLIPPVRVGNILIDLSVLVLFLVLTVLGRLIFWL